MKKRKSISKQLTVSILFISLSVLVLYVVIYIYVSKWHLKLYTNITESMGKEMAEETQDICTNTAEYFLRNMAAKDASFYSTELQSLANQMEIIGDELIPSLIKDYSTLTISEESYEKMFEYNTVVFSDEYVQTPKNRKEAYVLALMYNTCYGIASSSSEVMRMYLASDENYLVIYGEHNITRKDTFYYDSTWYKRAVENDGKTVWIEGYSDLISNKEVITCAKCIYNKEGDFIGVLAFDIDISKLYERYSKHSKENDVHGISYAIDANGNLALDYGCEEDYYLDDTDVEIILETHNGLINKDDYLLAYAEIVQTGWIYCTQIDKDVIADFLDRIDTKIADSEYKIRSEIYLNIVVLLILIIILSIIVFIVIVFESFLFSKKITKPIYQLIDSVKEVKDGHFDKKIEIATYAEIGQLADEFNTMMDSLNMYIRNLTEVTAEKEKIGAELQVATHIQKNMLSNNFDVCKNIAINAVMYPAKEVGGDFYDFFMVDANHFATVVADVSGKGIPAALFMARSMTVIRMLTKPGVSLSEVFRMANNYLCENNEEGLFVTAFEAILDIRTGMVEYVNAGHEKPFVRDSSGKYHAIEVDPGFVLAAIEDIDYEVGAFQMEVGDMFIQYTDGVPEAININNEMYGESRLEKCLNEHATEAVANILNSILKNVKDYVGEADQFDDTTILAFEYLEKGYKKSMSVEAKIDKYVMVQEFVTDIINVLEPTEEERAALNIAIEEIFVNIASYAYKDSNLPDNEKTAQIVADVSADNILKLEFVDKGIEFNPLLRDDPDVEARYEDRTVGGLGIYMVKDSMDAVYYERVDDKNILTIEKKLSK